MVFTTRPIVFLASICIAGAFATSANAQVERSAEQDKVNRNFDNLPLSFEPNVGQSASQVHFVAHSGASSVYLTQREAILVLSNIRQEGRHGPSLLRRRHLPVVHASGSSVLHIQFQGSNPPARISGLQPLPGKINYFLGNDRRNWHTGVPTFASVNYEEIYPGIDVRFYGDGQRLEYDFILKSGANPEQIAVKFGGASNLCIDGFGNILVSTAYGELEVRKPIVYQAEGNSSRKIEGDYTLTADGSVRFKLGDYDRSKPLTIDPAVYFSTYLGGSSYDYVTGIAVDPSGHVYITGITWSPDFPTTGNAFDPTSQSNTLNGGAAFVTELSPDGASLLYSTYLTGGAGAYGWSIALDSASPPNVYVMGGTCSADFPTTSNAYLPSHTPPICDYNIGSTFVAKLNPAVSGSNGLVYSTYLGGNGLDSGDYMAVDGEGNIYISGMTSSSNFPITQTAFQIVNKWGGAVGSTSGGDAFVSRIDPNQSGTASLVYSTYLGGSGNTSTGYGDEGEGIAVDASANVYVAGYTDSLDFPITVSAYSQTPPGSVVSGGWTGFLTKINTNGTGVGSLLYSTYLGGSNGNSNAGDEFFAVARGPNNLSYIGGHTDSRDFPVTPGSFRPSPPSNTDSIVFCIIDTAQSGPSSLSYSTFLSGNTGSQDNYDWAAGIAVDAAGGVYITGFVDSTDFPVTPGAFQTAFRNTNGGANSFVSELMPLGNGAADLVYSTFYGGSGNSANYGGDWSYGIALDSSNNAYIGGFTESADFPITAGAFQSTMNGPYDAFVAKLSLTPKVLPTPTITSLSVNSGVTGTPVMISGTNFGRNQGTSTVTFGGVAVTVSSWSSTSIIFQVPNSGGGPGTVQVTVQTSVAVSNSASFTVDPGITSVSPSSAAVGALVTINGSNLGSGSKGAIGSAILDDSNRSSTHEPEERIVIVNGAEAHIVSWSSTRIVVKVPEDASPGQGDILVIVQGIATNSMPFTVISHKDKQRS